MVLTMIFGVVYALWVYGQTSLDHIPLGHIRQQKSWLDHILPREYIYPYTIYGHGISTHCPTLFPMFAWLRAGRMWIDIFLGILQVSFRKCVIGINPFINEIYQIIPFIKRCWICLYTTIFSGKIWLFIYNHIFSDKIQVNWQNEYRKIYYLFTKLDEWFTL